MQGILIHVYLFGIASLYALFYVNSERYRTDSRAHRVSGTAGPLNGGGAH